MPPTGDPWPGKAAPSRERAKVPWLKLSGLSPRQRAVVGLRASGFRFTEIGNQLGISPGAAGFHHHAGIKNLRKKLRRAV